MARTPESDETKAENDLDDLARRYMDLWQKQLAQLSNDEAVSEMMAKTLGMMNAGMLDPKTNPFLAAFSTQAGTNTDGTQDGTKAASAPGGDPDHDVAELACRIDALERRIAELEAGPAKRSKRAQPKSKKR